MIIEPGAVISSWVLWTLGPLIAVAFLCIFARGLLRVAGPVLYSELIRWGRRRSGLYLRCGYALLLLVVLFGLYTQWFQPDLRQGLAVLFSPQELHLSRVAEFASSFFDHFLLVQYLAVLFVTPAVTAGAITDEKENGSIVLLLTSHLKDREIIIGKMLARIGGIVLLILTGLPLLSFLQFLGGVDPNLVFASTVLTLLNVLSIASLSIFNSVVFKRSRDAIFATYLQIIAYLGLTSLCCGTGSWGGSLDTFFWIIGGNGASQWVLIQKVVSGNQAGVELPRLLLGLLAWHGLFSGLLLVASIRLFRSHVVAELGGETKSPLQAETALKLQKVNPPVNVREPLLWKEQHFEGSQVLSSVVLANLSGFVVLFWFGSFFIFITGVSLLVDDPPRLAVFTNYWMRTISCVVCLSMWLRLALRSSISISLEQSRSTLDSLLMTGLSDHEILAAKWKATFLSLRPGAVALTIVYGIALLTGGFHPLALIAVIGANLAHIAFIITLGMLCSLYSSQPFRATVVTFVIGALSMGGHLLFGFCLVPLFLLLGFEEGAIWFGQFQWYGLTPLVTQWTLAFDITGLGADASGLKMQTVVSALLGVAFYGMVTLGLWLLLLKRFGPATGRLDGR